MPTSTLIVQAPQAPPIPPVIAPRVVIQGPGAGAQLEALQTQAAALARQLAGLRVQRTFLERQSRDVSGDAARAQLDASRANLDVQIAQAQVDLENVRAQIAAQENVPLSRVTTGGQVILQPPRVPRSPVDPEMVIGLSFALLMAIVLPLSIGLARRVWRGRPAPTGPKVDEIAPRLDRLEHAVDAIAIEVERISEGQRFVTKLLADRPTASATASAAGRPDGVDGPMADARQMRALGAGPVEPIRVGERQAVRQMNTPH
jgi:hypothetical protein